VSEERSDEFSRGLPDKSSNAANPKGRVVGCPGGSPRGAGQAAPFGSPWRRKAGYQTAPKWPAWPPTPWILAFARMTRW